MKVHSAMVDHTVSGHLLHLLFVDSISVALARGVETVVFIIQVHGTQSHRFVNIAVFNVCYSLDAEGRLTCHIVSVA